MTDALYLYMYYQLLKKIIDKNILSRLYSNMYGLSIQPKLSELERPSYAG